MNPPVNCEPIRLQVDVLCIASPYFVLHDQGSQYWNKATNSIFQKLLEAALDLKKLPVTLRADTFCTVCRLHSCTQVSSRTKTSPAGAAACLTDGNSLWEPVRQPQEDIFVKRRTSQSTRTTKPLPFVGVSSSTLKNIQ